VIIVLSDGWGLEDAVDEATAARDEGVQVYTLGLAFTPDDTHLRAVAGRDDRYVHDPTTEQLAAIYSDIERVAQYSLAGNLVIYDEMAPDIEYIGGSAIPSAIEDGGLLMWSNPLLPLNGIQMSYRIRPQRTGMLPTNLSAVAKYTDSGGQRQQYVFPVPEVEVIAPTETPPPPTLTPRTPRIYLPVVLGEECEPEQVRVDVALVIDASTSMRDLTRAGRPKLTAEVDAVTVFLNRLDMPGDRAALVQFNSSAKLLHPLSGNRGSLVASLGRIQVAQQTRIDLGVEKAREELAAGNRAPGSQAVIVLLTDGKANPVSPTAAIDEALRAKIDGIAVIAIGLGEDADLRTLEAMVSRPGYLYRAPDAEDLADIYRQIAVEIPCPVHDYWGQR
jgi:Mg-chelatase subunit ChlD